jgi:hypothetical protein
MIDTKRFKWTVLIGKIITVVVVLILNYIKALEIGGENGSVWKWLSVWTSIVTCFLLILSEVFYLRKFIRTKYIPQKESSVDVASTSRNWLHPNQKESTVEIKQIEKPLDREKDDLIKKFESFKKIKVLFILRNDIDQLPLPLPGEPLKRYSSHFSIGKIKR